MLYAYSNDENIKVSENDFHMSAARYGSDVFIYLETEHDENPVDIAKEYLTGNLAIFPNGEVFVEMTDIFHYSFPATDEY